MLMQLIVKTARWVMWNFTESGVLTNFEKETRQDNACAWVSFLM